MSLSMIQIRANFSTTATLVTEFTGIVERKSKSLDWDENVSPLWGDGCWCRFDRVSSSSTTVIQSVDNVTNY